MSKHQKSRSAAKRTIFVTVLGGVAEVDGSTVPRDVDVVIIDIDTLEDEDAVATLSPKAKAYAKRNGYI